jgi:F-type H+-transporting ATPase subunit epsilon
MKLQLITLTGTKFSDDVYEVLLPTETGPIAVFPGHAPLVTLIKDGVISVRRSKSDGDSQLDHYALTGGIAEINGELVRVLVDEAEHSDEINAGEAQKALERAQALKTAAKNEVDIEKAQAMIDRQAIRLQVAGLRRHSRR